MKKLSIKLKVTLWFTVAMIFISVAALAAISSINAKMFEQEAHDRITKTVDDMSRTMFTPDGRIRRVPDFKFYGRGVHMALYDSEYNLAGGQVPFGITKELEFSDGKLRMETYNGRKYYVYDKKIASADGTSFWIKGMMSAADEMYNVNSYLKNNIIITVILIVVAALGGYVIISRAFVPVNKITETAKAIIESGNLSERIEIGKGRDEISSLANTFDKMLDKIEQTLEREKQFTSDASHELRTPVAVILSECEYMEECANSIDEYKESVDSVKRQAEKMSKLISELLMITRMDKKTLQMNFEDTDISELLTFVCDEQVDIHDANIVMKREIAPRITANAERSLLARLFINLISNAYQYSGENGVIKVSLTQSGDNVVFSVSDNGIGIAEDDIPKIWERFYQVDPSRTSNENGSMGLGLSMVKWIAKCHRGNVSVESQVGAGGSVAQTV